PIGHDLVNFRFCLCVISAHEDIMGPRDNVRGHHYITVYGVQCFDDLCVGKRPLYLLANRIGIAHSEGGWHALREIQWVGYVYQNFPLEVSCTSQLQCLQRRCAGSAIENDFAEFGGFSESTIQSLCPIRLSPLHSLLVPCRAGTHFHFMAQLNKLRSNSIPYHSRPQHAKLHSNDSLMLS